MTRIKIVCAAPKTEKLVGLGATIETYPSIADVMVLAIDDDGTERDLSGSVSRVTWEVTPGEVPIATVEFFAPEIDVEGVIEPPPRPREQPPFPSALRLALEEHDAKMATDLVRGAPLDDEPYTAEERAAVAKARGDVRAGRVMPTEELMRRLDDPDEAKPGPYS